MLIRVRQERELRDVEQRYPAEHYVLVDDKPRILAAAKQVWSGRFTAVFPRQGHYAHDRNALATCRPADIGIDRISDLPDMTWSSVYERVTWRRSERPSRVTRREEVA